MMRILRRKFVVFAMMAVTILLLVLAVAINGLHGLVLAQETDVLFDSLIGLFSTSAASSEPLPQVLPQRVQTMQPTRIFILRTDADGQVLDITTDPISTIDTETAQAYAQSANEPSGRIGSLKYRTVSTGDERLIFFVDVSEQNSTFVTVLVLSSVIIAVCWLLILLFVILLSGRVVRPIAAGMEKQKQFITNAGHELKTPLAIIQSNNDAMTLIHGENKYNSHIRLQTQRLSVLMNNLLTLARFDEEMKLPTEPVNISELIESLLPAYRDAAAERNIGLSAELRPGIHLAVHKDTFAQMIVVLLDNAVKYTPDGGDIRVALNRENGHIVFTEENSCEAVHESDAGRLFERFYRGDAARTQKNASSGYGIGLSAAQAIAETFGGRLTAEYPTPRRIRFTARF